MRKYTLAILTFISLLFPMMAQAEYCWMMSCVGEVGYVYIPASQMIVKAETMEMDFNGVKYKLDPTNRMLKGFGLPSIGSTVELNINVTLLSKDDIDSPSILQEIKLPWFALNNDQLKVQLHKYDFNDELVGAGLMRSGARFKILSYVGDYFAGHSRLFALVYIESD